MEDRTLRAVLDAAPVAAVVVGSDRTIRGWNRAAETITGWTAEQVIGRRDPMIPEGRHERVDVTFDAWLHDPDDLERVVVPRRRADGTMFQLCVESVAAVDLDDGPGLTVWFSEATDLDALVLARNQLSRRLADATRIDEVVPVLTAAIQDVLVADDAVVLRRCPPGDHLHGVRGLGMETEDAEQVQLDLGVGDAWDEAAEGWLADGTLDLGDGGRPTSFVPMGPEGAGWVLATRGTHAASAGAHVRDLFQAVADETWAALQRVALVSDLDGKIEILEATSRLAGSVGLDLDDALEAVTRQAADALSCERAAVYLVDPDTEDVVLAHVHASDAHPEQLLAEDDGLALAREVVHNQAEVLYQDVSACEIAEGPWHADAGSVAVMGLPLMLANRCVGALVVAHTIAHPRGFTSLCQQVGAAVSQQAALAVEHARLFEAERHNVQRLEELDRMKADWMAGVTHDLKAPVTTLLGFVHTLRRMTGQVTEEQQRHFLEVMSRQADRLVGLVEDLLLSARVEADAAARRRELVHVDQLVVEAVESLDPDGRAQVRVRDEGIGASVVGDRAHLQRVLVNLLTNGLRHGGDELCVHVTNEDGKVLIAVEDDGPGVPPEHRELIFDRFVHGDHEASSGLGLYVAKGIVEAHDGSIVVTDRPDGRDGARFELRFPRARKQREQDLEEGLPVDHDRRRNESVVGLAG